MCLRRTHPGRHSRDTRCTRAAPSGASKDAGASAALRVVAGTGERAGARRLGATGAAVLAPRLRPFLLVLLLLLVRVIVAGSHLRRAKRQPAGERLPTLALSHISESTQPPVFQGRRRRMGCARPLCGAARGCGHGCASPGRGAASLARRAWKTRREAVTREGEVGRAAYACSRRWMVLLKTSAPSVRAPGSCSRRPAQLTNSPECSHEGACCLSAACPGATPARQKVAGASAAATHVPLFWPCADAAPGTGRGRRQAAAQAGPPPAAAAR